MRGGDLSAARTSFVEAGGCAATHGLWRAAVRCYRRALELDSARPRRGRQDRPDLGRVATGNDWVEYGRVLDANPGWPAFGCQSAQIVVGDLGSVVTCPGVGAVLELMMVHDDMVDVHPDARFTAMPLAMAMVILRRAMWPVPREHAGEPPSVRVTFAAGRRVQLDEQGDWQPLQ